MLLAIDVGNTHTVFAVMEGETVCGQWRLATNIYRTSDEYAVTLMQLMEHQGISAGHITHAMLSSVVPDAVFPIRILCRRYFKTECHVVGDDGCIPNMNVVIDRPQQLGADRLINAFAAQARYGKGLVIIDFGTATTFDVVNHEGAYAGGVIAPGINLSLEALHHATSKLPAIAIDKPVKAIGTNTIDAMQSGIYYGYIGLIEGIVRRIGNELGGDITVIATGGLASLYAKSTDIIQHVESDLTLAGLQLLAQQIDLA